MTDWKDTVMSDEQIEKWLLNRLGKGNVFKQFNRQFCKDLVQAQAEISFKAGKQAGVREVVEFIETMQPLEFNSLWQAKLKEWRV